MTVTVAEIEASHAEEKRIRAEIAKMARGIYAIRKGSPLDGAYSLDSFYLTDFPGSHFCGFEEEDEFPIGTPVVSTTFYWSRAGHGINVTIPQAYLGDDNWADLERQRVQARAAAIAIGKFALGVGDMFRREAAARAQYERLRQRFG